MAKEKLKRELEREALARIEDAARSADDFENVVAWWNRLDANRERRERDREIGRGDIPLEWNAPKDALVIPNSRMNVFWREAMRGDFIDIMFDCPYEMHELVEDADLSELIHKLSENHREVLFYSASICTIAPGMPRSGDRATATSARCAPYWCPVYNGSCWSGWKRGNGAACP